MSPIRAATLMGLEGRGYGTVESLPSLGKGRSCTGIFITDERHRDMLRAAHGAGRPVRFKGVVHARQVSAEAELQVEIARVDPPEEGEVTVEFTAMDVPYDLVG